MFWYIKLLIYLFSLIFSFIVVYQIDFYKFMRKGKADYSIFLWLIISISLGYLIASLYIELIEIVWK
jgi:uncharacterized membrane protein YwzB